MRKAADFEVTQRITIRVDTDAEMRDALDAHRDYVTGETLALALDFGEVAAEATDLNGHAAKIDVAKA